jgi:hypothetical protein
LAALTGRPVSDARLVALPAPESAYSGSRLLAVETNGGIGPRLLVKRIAPAWDYFMRVTDDERGREMLAWHTGLLDRLPPELGHAVLACAHDGDGWAILMRDVGPSLLARRAVVSATDHAAILDGMAAFHATFWEQTALVDPEQGFNHPWHHYHIISPAAALRDPDPSGVMPRIVRDGWDALPALVGDELAGTLLALATDPGALLAAFARYPRTVVHADFRHANIGVERLPGPRAIVLDWALIGPGPATLDVIWYLIHLGSRSPAAVEDSLATYRRQLAMRLGARFDERWWQPLLELGYLGGLIRYGWIAARALHVARDEAARARIQAEMAPWIARARLGLARLGG